ncbi:MAG: biotin--[acetyl-CoA-carboxylase] ligase [Isosphaeraceae bacterium]
MTPIGRVDPGPWPFVRTMLVLDEVESTSDLAVELVGGAGIVLPLCVWSARQTRGRGQGENAWWSDSGSLTFTVAVAPAAHGLPPEAEPSLALAAAVAVIDALDSLGYRAPGLGIRWPNDVELDGRKLAGILPERVEAVGQHWLLIGIGINVASDLAEAPASVRSMATSVSALPGPPVDAGTPARLLAAILERLAPVIGQLAARDGALAARWRALDLLRDERACVDLGDQVVAGRGCGIDEDGALCLDRGGTVVRLFGGRVLR